MPGHEEKAITVNTEDDLTCSQFARYAGISRARTAMLKVAGMISEYSLKELARFKSNSSSLRLTDTSEELIVIRLGPPDGSHAGYSDDMTLGELTEVVRGPWARNPNTLPDIDVVHVTYAGFVIGVFEFDKDNVGPGKVDASGVERWDYDLKPLNTVKRKSRRSEKVTHHVRNKPMSKAKLNAMNHVKLQLLTPAGGPVVAGYPLQK